jgi:GNAT superfamily N-acetyltransferase
MAVIMLKIYPVETDEHVKTAKMLFAEFNSCLKTKLPEYTELPPENRGPIRHTLIANYNGVDVGCVRLREESGAVCIMLGLYVKPEFRGKKIGKRLAADIIKYARQKGYDYMRLDTYEPLGNAISLYMSLGFKTIDCYHEFPAELKELAVCMELKL